MALYFVDLYYTYVNMCCAGIVITEPMLRKQCCYLPSGIKDMTTIWNLWDVSPSTLENLGTKHIWSRPTFAVIFYCA